ncbi:metallophosphoesterase [Taibaiella chishuiensis]|uniref:Icc-related predicted phosphoesterase n=1 Tax=Taibaiella chishuiensis TaxID=1434707 RepID=A0A2P8CZG6_9BACT|nr:metallophosphoesterase [Taibaiella chishuiensis]PSK90361.1 Icc-related predicted phosphoesterase [Taibaiella chishuiensis]
MKIQIISDLHQEFGITLLDFRNADLVIFAGDVNLGTKGIAWIKEQIPDKPVIYVLGNHEYYKGTYPKALHQVIAAAEGSNIIVLENNSVELEGIRFHGATLWTDFALFGDSRSYGIICQEQMNDYKRIRRYPSYSKLRSIDTFNIHHASRAWLERSLAESGARQNIVITHHAPSIRSLPEQYRNDTLSAAYASDLESLIRQYQPAYWIHGHIHTPSRYTIAGTEIICNPHGYIDEKYNGYDRELIITV